MLARGLVWPMAALACLAAYLGVRHALSPEEVPSAANDPAAKSGQDVAPVANAPPVVAPPAAVSGVQRRPEPEPPATGAAPPAERDSFEPDTKAPVAQLASAERARDRSRGHRPRDAREHTASAEVTKEAPVAPPPAVEAAPSEPEHEVDAPAVRARAAADALELAAEKSHSTESAPAKAKPAADKAEGPKPALPLQANVQIQALEIHGSLPTSLVRRALDRIRGQFSACYVRAAQAAGRNGFGEVLVSVQIDERGRARSPVARGAALPQLDACIGDATSKLVSEKAPDTGTVSASWKVTFTP
jgi:hypothetical protein